jgi:hypothetical protein
MSDVDPSGGMREAGAGHVRLEAVMVGQIDQRVCAFIAITEESAAALSF